MVGHSYELMDTAKDEIMLVSGDRDLVPAVERLRKRNIKADMVFWEHASTELKPAASKFVSMNPHLDLPALKV